MYIPVDDMRLRPTFAKLDKESRKWAELCYAFMEDVSRDGDFLNIVDITYIMGTKLQEKVDRYETEIAELNNKCEDLQYDNDMSKQKTHTLELRLEQSEEEIRQRLQVCFLCHLLSSMLLCVKPIYVYYAGRLYLYAV